MSLFYSSGHWARKQIQHPGVWGCSRNLVWWHPCSDSVPRIPLETLLHANHWRHHTERKGILCCFQEVKKCPSHTAPRLCIQYQVSDPRKRKFLNYLNYRVGGVDTSNWLDRGTWNRHNKAWRTWSRNLLSIWSFSDLGVRDWKSGHIYRDNLGLSEVSSFLSS